MTIDVSRSKAQRIMDEMEEWSQRKGMRSEDTTKIVNALSKIYWQGRDDERDPSNAYDRRDDSR